MTLEAGKSYWIDLEGSPAGAGTLADPYLRGVHDSNSDYIPNTARDNGGEGSNSRWFFTARSSGTHYVAAGASGNETGTYRLSAALVPDDYLAAHYPRRADGGRCADRQDRFPARPRLVQAHSGGGHDLPSTLYKIFRPSIVNVLTSVGHL